MLILILGAGGHGQVTADILFQMRAAGQDLEIQGFLDENPALHGSRIMGLPIPGPQALLETLGHDAVVAAIGDNNARQRIFELLAPAETFFTAIHPSAVIAPDATLGAGVMVCAGAIINPGAVIGENTIINTGATVDHHCRIGPHCHLAPGVHLGGNVRVGQGSFLGIGANVIPETAIGDRASIGAGATVITDVPDRETWVGVPAKKLASNPC